MKDVLPLDSRRYVGALRADLRKQGDTEVTNTNRPSLTDLEIARSGELRIDVYIFSWYI